MWHRTGLEANSQYIMMDSFQLPGMPLTRKGLEGIFSAPILRAALVSHLPISLKESECVLSTCLQVSVLSLTPPTLSGRNWNHAAVFLPYRRAVCCAKYCFMLLFWSALHNCLEKSTFVDNPKEGDALNTILLGHISWVKCIKILLQWNSI